MATVVLGGQLHEVFIENVHIMQTSCLSLLRSGKTLAESVDLLDK